MTKDEGKVVAVHAMKVCRRSRKPPLMLNLGSRWRWVVTITPWSFYAWGKSPQYPLNRRIGG
jgi:hypothetical protein